MPKLKSSCLFTWRVTGTEDPEGCECRQRLTHVQCPIPFAFLAEQWREKRREGGRAGKKHHHHPTSAVHCAPCCHLVVEEEKTRATFQHVSKPICPLPSRLPGRSCPLLCAQSTEAPLGQCSVPWVFSVVILKCVSCFLGIP